MSFLEIHNEKIYDLLYSSKNQRRTCKLRNNKNDQVFVQGVKEMEVTSQQAAMAVLRQGIRNRQVKGGITKRAVNVKSDAYFQHDC